MKVLVSVLIGMFMFCGIVQGQDEVKSIKIASYNIRYGSMGTSPTAWPKRRSALTKQIEAINPDIICMQEVLYFQYEDIAAHNPDCAFIGCGRDDGKMAGEFSPILYNTKRFAACESGVFWLSETPDVPGSIDWDSACTRICTWARFIDRVNEKGFYVFNTHLDHVSQAAQDNGVALIMKNIAERTFKDDPYILTGDFNAVENSELITKICNSGNSGSGLKFGYPYRKINPDVKDVASFNGFRDNYRNNIIDYIFTATEFTTVDAGIENHKVDGVFPSDHFPIWAVVEFESGE